MFNLDHDPETPFPLVWVREEKKRKTWSPGFMLVLVFAKSPPVPGWEISWGQMVITAPGRIVENGQNDCKSKFNCKSKILNFIIYGRRQILAR